MRKRRSRFSFFITTTLSAWIVPVAYAAEETKRPKRAPRTSFLATVLVCITWNATKERARSQPDHAEACNAPGIAGGPDFRSNIGFFFLGQVSTGRNGHRQAEVLPGQDRRIAPGDRQAIRPRLRGDHRGKSRCRSFYPRSGTQDRPPHRMDSSGRTDPEWNRRQHCGNASFRLFVRSFSYRHDLPDRNRRPGEGDPGRDVHRHRKNQEPRMACPGVDPEGTARSPGRRPARTGQSYGEPRAPPLETDRADSWHESPLGYRGARQSRMHQIVPGGYLPAVRDDPAWDAGCHRQPAREGDR